MGVPQKQLTPGSRFPRGPELCLWLAGVLLICYGLTHSRLEEIMTGGAPAIDKTRQQSRSDAHTGQIRSDTPQETFCKNIFAIIESKKDIKIKDELMESIVNAIAIPDMPFMIDDIHKVGRSLEKSELADEICLRLIRRWTKSDGRAASAWVQQLPENPMRESALLEVAVQWANTNLNEAADWARQLAVQADQSAAISTVANEAVRVDPIQALRLAMELPADDQRNILICRSSMEWATQDGKSAADWAIQINDVQLRNQVLAAVATAWSMTDPVSAATLAANDIPAGRAQSDAVVGIIERWAQQQPEQAAAWVETFPDGELKSVATANVVAMWSLSDSQKAEQWRNQIIAKQ